MQLTTRLGLLLGCVALLGPASPTYEGPFISHDDSNPTAISQSHDVNPHGAKNGNAYAIVEFPQEFLHAQGDPDFAELFNPSGLYDYNQDGIPDLVYRAQAGDMELIIYPEKTGGFSFFRYFQVVVNGSDGVYSSIHRITSSENPEANILIAYPYDEFDPATDLSISETEGPSCDVCSIGNSRFFVDVHSDGNLPAYSGKIVERHPTTGPLRRIPFSSSSKIELLRSLYL